MALQRFANTHQRHAHAFHLGRAQPPEQFCPAEREEIAVEIAGQLVDVGQGDHEANRYAFIFGDAHQAFEDDRLQLLADIGDFGRGERHETPVIRPGIVENIEDQGGFLVELRLVHRPRHQLGVAFGESDDALHHFREGLADGQRPGVQILGAGVAARRHHPFVIGPVVPHHHRGRPFKSLHQQAWLIPHGKAERAKRAGHALLAQPVFCGTEQRFGHGGIIDAFEHAPVAGAGPAAGGSGGDHQLIDLRRNAADHVAVLQGQPEGGFGMAEPGVGFDAANQAEHFGFQRRHPVRIMGVEFPHQIDEGLAVGSAFNALEGDRAHRWR